MAKFHCWTLDFRISQQGLLWLHACCAGCLSGRERWLRSWGISVMEKQKAKQSQKEQRKKEQRKKEQMSSFCCSVSQTNQAIPADCMLYSPCQKHEENICICSGIGNYFSCQRRVKNQNPQAPLFLACLLLVTAGDWVLAWKASYWPYYILIKSKLFSGLE